MGYQFVIPREWRRSRVFLGGLFFLVLSLTGNPFFGFFYLYLKQVTNMISRKHEMENVRIDIAYTARYLNGISPKLQKHKELSEKLEKLRKRLSELKKEYERGKID